MSNLIIPFRANLLESGSSVDTTFKITVDTTKAGSASDTFVLRLYPGAANMTVYWGDGSSDLITAYNQAELTHVYSLSGSYQITLDGSFYGIAFGNTGDKLKLSSIDNWGLNVWGIMSFAFYGCSNMTANYSDSPDTSSVQKMFQAFSGCTLFNGDLNINTSLVSDMRNMFYNCTNFNGYVPFDTSNVTVISDMFYGCTNFNQPVNFNTVNATSTVRMFMFCSSFNQSINFDFTSCTSTTLMFYQCTSFNSPVTFTNGGGVTSFSNTFNGCTIFNQDISSFNITSITTAVSMLIGTAFSKTNYDLLLPAWDAYGTSSVPFHAGTAQYAVAPSAPATAHANMISRSWTITDGGPI